MGFSKRFRGVSLRVVAVLLVCLAIGSVIAYVFVTIKFPVNVEEPLSVVDYPNFLELFPNMTQSFNITINNAAPVNYLVALNFSLNDTVYQESYVTFSHEIYTVIPGPNSVPANITVAPDAPPAQFEVEVTLNRVSAAWSIFDYTFSWGSDAQHITNGTLAMMLNFTLTNDSLLMTVQVNDTTLSSYSYLGVVFDREFDGFHVGDQGYLLTSDNRQKNGVQTRLSECWALTDIEIHPPRPSPWHYCTFNNETGYTFHINFPRSVLPEKSAHPADQYGQVQRVHVDYGLGPGAFVEVEFSFEDFRG